MPDAAPIRQCAEASADMGESSRPAPPSAPRHGSRKTYNIGIFEGEFEYLFPHRATSFHPWPQPCLEIHLQVRTAARLSLRDFAPSDLRSTGEENPTQADFDLGWIEVAIAREEDMRRHRIYEIDLYGEVLRHMIQEWANMIDAWVPEARCVPALVPITMACPIS